MEGDIRRKTASFAISIWYNADTGHIHLARPSGDGFITTISGDPNSARGHVHLYRKLADALQRQGLPGPPTDLRVERD